jgi:hypothetical protein
MIEGRVFRTDELIPGLWRRFLDDGPVRIFNPGLLHTASGWLLAFRVVGPDLKRRIGLTRLTSDFLVQTETTTAFTDYIRFGPQRRYSEYVENWFADPRLFRLDERVFMYWNSGWHDPENVQFIQEIDVHALRPIGAPRELRLRGPRRKIEKNWSFFESGAMYAIYSVSPHRVLKFSLDGEDHIDFEPVCENDWDTEKFVAHYGEIRNGAPPQRVGDRYFSVCHSRVGSPDGVIYLPSVYCFSATFPFRPIAPPRRPLALPNPWGTSTDYERLNPSVAQVVYPCGAAYDQNHWIISYGINDEHCAIAVLSAAELADSIEAVAVPTL